MSKKNNSKSTSSAGNATASKNLKLTGRRGHTGLWDRGDPLDTIDQRAGKYSSPLMILLIAFIGITVYLQTITFDFTLDDTIYAGGNEAVNEGISRTGDIFSYGSLHFFTATPTSSGTYRPVTLLSFALEKYIFGEFSPVTGHLINIVLYFLVLVTVGFLLKKLFEIKGIPVLMAMAVLLVYAIHPVHTEVVASIKSRDTLLCALFAFMALYIIVRNVIPVNQRKSEDPGNHMTVARSILAGLLFFMSVLSKEESLPLVVVAFLIPWFFMGKTLKRSFRIALPFIIVAVLYLVIRFSILEPESKELLSTVNNILYGATGGERILTNMFIWLFYVRLLIWPFGLSWDYSYNEIPLIDSANTIILFLVILFIALIWFAVRGFSKKSIIAFGVLFYLTTFAIFSNIIPAFTIGATVAERFLFIPSLGFAIVLVCGIWQLTERLKQTEQRKLLGTMVLLSPVILAFYIYSFSRTGVWKDNLTLFESGIISAPDSWRTNVYYAKHLFIKANEMVEKSADKTKLPAEAESLYRQSAQSYRRGIDIYSSVAGIKGDLVNLSYLYLVLKDTVNAERTIARTLNKYPADPDALYYKGLIEFGRKKYKESNKYFNESLKISKLKEDEIKPRIAEGYFRMNDTLKAGILFREVLKNNPADPNGLFFLGLMEFPRNHFEKCINYMQKSLKAGSERKYDIYQTLAKCYVNLGKEDEAVSSLEKSLQITPDIQTYAVLSYLYSKRGDIRKSEEYRLKINDLNSK